MKSKWVIILVVGWLLQIIYFEGMINVAWIVFSFSGWDILDFWLFPFSSLLSTNLMIMGESVVFGFAFYKLIENKKLVSKKEVSDV